MAHLPYYYHLPVLIAVISLVYSATRFDSWPAILRESMRWVMRLTVFLFGIITALFLLANFI